MAIEVPPTRLPPSGRSPRTAMAVALVSLLAVTGFGLLGRSPAESVPARSPLMALASPSPWPVPTPSPTSPSIEAAAATPTPAPPCLPPRITALTAPIPRHPRALAPTGFETLTPWSGAEGTLVADARDGFWALGNGRLSRLDAGGAMTASWTFADDAAFGSWGLVPARQGGVWLFGGPSIAWFDGTRFRDVTPVPSTAAYPLAVVDVAEAADGSLWAASYDARAASGDPYAGSVSSVYHWDGRSWSDGCPPLSSDQQFHLAIDPRGRVWVARDSVPGDVASFDGTAWSTVPRHPTYLPNAGVARFIAADDGSVWEVASGLGRFGGTSWTSLESRAVDLGSTVNLAVAHGGTVWAVTGAVTLPGTDPANPVRVMGIEIARYDGHAWTVFDSKDGLPAPDAANATTITAVAASRDGVLAATADGFYRLSADRWQRVGPRPAVTVTPQRLLGVSNDEAWVGTWDTGLWHIRNGTWTNVSIAAWKPPLHVIDLARAQDGTLAVTTDQGAAVLRHGRWTVLEEGEATGVAFARDGTLWISGAPSDGSNPTVASFRFDGRAWTRHELPPPTTPPGWTWVALGPGGLPWVGSGGWVGSLSRFDGSRWVPVFGARTVDVFGHAVAPNGDLWVGVILGDAGTWYWALARCDDTSVTTWRTSDLLAVSSSVVEAPVGAALFGGLAVAPDGTLWAATDQGLLRFDGRRWSLSVAGSSISALSFAPDGTLWAVGPSGVQALPAGRSVGPEVSVP